ncbi:uncharacterized protein LOC143897075 isoform X2 [Temnothorax americanus]|uniref:uncharacterized protein LOC143897075 isoform X2 n=1 Tax=Temnothorax americanus TaxID=1964332 RepID=UPI0040683180
MKVENTVSKAIEICLRIFGIWPTTSCILLRRLFWTVMLIIEQVYQYRYIVMHFELSEIFDIMKILSSTMAYTIFFIKLIIFWYKQRTFNSILTMMAIDWENRSNTKFSMSATTYNAKLSQRFANMTVILYLISIIFFSSDIFVKRVDNEIASNISTPILILEMDLPFDVNRRFVYESVIIVQFLHLILCAEAIGLLNALLINLILHISGQIDILRKSVTEIFPKKGKCSPSRSVVKEIIKKHQKVIIFSEHIEDLYSYIALVLFVSDTLIICCLGFAIVASIGQPNALKIILRTLLFYFNTNLEAFIFCFAGEHLSDKLRDPLFNRARALEMLRTILSGTNQIPDTVKLYCS